MSSSRPKFKKRFTPKPYWCCQPFFPVTLSEEYRMNEIFCFVLLTTIHISERTQSGKTNVYSLKNQEKKQRILKKTVPLSRRVFAVDFVIYMDMRKRSAVPYLNDF